MIYSNLELLLGCLWRGERCSAQYLLQRQKRYCRTCGEWDITRFHSSVGFGTCYVFLFCTSRLLDEQYCIWRRKDNSEKIVTEQKNLWIKTESVSLLLLSNFRKTLLPGWVSSQDFFTGRSVECLSWQRAVRFFHQLAIIVDKESSRARYAKCRWFTQTSNILGIRALDWSSGEKLVDWNSELHEESKFVKGNTSHNWLATFATGIASGY